MNPKSIYLSIIFFIPTTLSQLPPTFFTSSFTSGFPGFNGFGQLASQQLPTAGNGRTNTGTTIQGPILFPPAPESRDTSGVIVGASGYGFIPPGVREISQGRGLEPAQLTTSFGQPFTTNYFGLPS